MTLCASGSKTAMTTCLHSLASPLSNGRDLAVSVPPFSQLYPSVDVMDRQQRRFYAGLESKLRRGECPEIEGNISYVFIFLYKLLASVRERGFESLHDYLIRLSEGYANEPRLSWYCRHWAYDCLLGQRKYELYLEKTEPPSPLGMETHASNLRLNIQAHCGLKANPLDIVRMFESRGSRFVREHSGLYRDCIYATFDRVADNEGPWFDYLESDIEIPQSYSPHSLFQGAVVPYGIAELDFGLQAFYSSSETESRVKQLTKVAENDAREIVGFPKVGEGWISETALFRTLQKHFRQTIVVQHGQPAWLGRQHFDVWFPDWNIAVEFHGEQHFQAVKFFGGSEAFDKNRERDARKAALAVRHGVKLFVATKDYDVAELIAGIEATLRRRGPILPPDA